MLLNFAEQKQMGAAIRNRMLHKFAGKQIDQLSS